MAAADVYLGYSNRIRSHLDVGSQAKSRGNSSAYELALHDASRDAIEALSMLVEDTTFWGGVTSFAGARSNSDVARTITLYLPSLLRQLGIGACQGSCRLIYAAKGCLRSAFMWSATTESRSGLRVTAPIGDQSRVVPDQRAGLRSRALRYSSCRAARMA